MASVSLTASEKEPPAETWCRCSVKQTCCGTAPLSSISGTIGDAVSKVRDTGKPVVRQRQTESITCPKGVAISYGAYVVLPLKLNELVVGTFGLFSSTTDAFHAEEMRLLCELAGDLSFALDHIEKEEQLNYLAYYDSLTGLPNKKLLLEHLPLQCKSACRDESMVALLLVDLMNFSDVNDTYGRHVGDSLLMQVGERLQSATDNRETVAKVGADRFALSLTGLDETDQVAHRLEQEVLQSFTAPFTIDETVIYLAVQVGVSLFPSDGSDPDTVYNNAEIALKLAQSKTAPYLFYNAAMNEVIIHSVTMEAKIRKVIENDELIVYYQPKVAADDGSIIGMEALVRYEDQEKGLITPSDFIPLAEETGLIIELGELVMRRAAEDMRHWRNLDLDPPRVAVNVSAVQLRQMNFVETVSNLLSTGGEDHGLDMEITESGVMTEVAENIPKLQAVREMGFRISIDDFGTGYSSLSYLSRLPVNTLKIDQSFIMNMTEHPNNLAIVTTIITLAHSLGLDVVAEGVELEEQAKLLRLLRCDCIQGFLYHPPLSREKMTVLLGR